MKESLGIRYDGEQLAVLDQQMLPNDEIWLQVEGPDHMVEIIRALKVRGAPMIGVAASLALACYHRSGASREDFLTKAKALRESRPTAVNLMIAVDRMIAVSAEQIVATAEAIFDEDVELCAQMGRTGAELVDPGDRILTHCNTGGLATAGDGTAFSVIRTAHQQGKNISVFVDETRPLLQGGRLTTWELEKRSIPYTLICDNMAGHLMSEGQVSKVFLGSDRIARNGDFANKIGTYSLAVLAHFHRVPFYVVAPSTTVDLEIASGANIPIEQRAPDEVRGVFGSFGKTIWAPKEANVYNPAFDVTPSQLVTGYVIDGELFASDQMKQMVQYVQSR